MFERRSALSAHEPANKPGPAPVRIGEMRGFALVQVAASASNLEALERTVRFVLGVEVPKTIGISASNGVHHAFKIGPEHFWIVGPEDTSVASLREAVLPEIGSVTSLSHGRTRLFIEGAAARELLSKGIALDLHPEAFRVDAFALTDLQHTPVLLHRTGVDRYELYVLRTYAVWIWEWLMDAALPFGHEVGA